MSRKGGNKSFEQNPNHLAGVWNQRRIWGVPPGWGRGGDLRVASGCANMSQIGHFGSVAFANIHDIFDPNGANAALLYRGYRTHIRYEGLVQIP